MTKLRTPIQGQFLKNVFLTLITLLLAGGLLLIWYSNQRNAVQAGWSPVHTAWLQRKQLTLTNNSGATLNSTAIVTVTVNSKALVDLGQLQSDCDDLRIVHSTAGELTRYVSFPSGLTCSTSTATKINFALQANITNGSSDTNYFLYYNNSTATAPTNDYTALTVGTKSATFICPFDGTTTCTAAGTGTPSTETGAVRYSGSKSALSFNGVSDVVTSSSISTYNAFTAEAWVKINSNSSAKQGILSNGTGFAQKLINIYIQSGTLQAYFSDSSSSACGGSVSLRTIDSGDDIRDGTWHHVAQVYDGTTETLYLDGVSQGTSTRTGYVCNTGALYVGLTDALAFDYANYYANGVIDEVRVSNIVRYSSNFTAPTLPFVRDANTKFLFHFDENGDDPRNTGKTIDDSGNGNHGTITGAKFVAGAIGDDASTSDTGKIDRQSYAGHEGIILEGGTTNKITNPSFENSTYDTNWNSIDIGTGGDGAITLTAAKNINTDTIATGRSYADGIAYRVGAPAAAATTVTRYSGSDTISNGIAVGDEVLLINLQGASGDVADVGKYEFKRVSAISSSVITFDTAITKTYAGTTASNQKVIVQRVPQYTSVTINSGGSLTASAWDGLTTTPTGTAGYLTGIVAFRATGTVTVDATTSISVNGKGYRGGGAGSAGANGGSNGESYDGSNGTGGSGAGAGETNGGGRSGNGAVASPNNGGARGGGGGGGSDGSTNTNGSAGGGGGGAYGGGGAGGGGGADSGAAGGAGGNGGDTGVAGGGGAGGCWGPLTAAGVGGDAGSAGGTANCTAGAGVGGEVGSGATSASGGGGGAAGGAGGGGGGGGGYYGSTTLTTMFPGSGGGGGGGGVSTSNAGAAGSAGGGIVFIAATTVSVSGTVSANGSDGVQGSTASGSGGGGAGGSVYIMANSATLGTTLVTSSGGAKAAAGTQISGSGAGGVGRIYVVAPTISGTTSPTATTGSTPSNLTVTSNTTAPYYKFGSKSAKIVASATAISGTSNTLYTTINAGSTGTHALSAYVYDGTTGNVGGTVSSSIAKLVYNGTAQTTTYTNMGSGWWRLTFSATGINAVANYGVEAQVSKTVYVDGFQLEAPAAGNYYTSYTDGSLGTGYAWDTPGSPNNSSSTRTITNIRYSTTDNFSVTEGSLSFWYKVPLTMKNDSIGANSVYSIVYMGNSSGGWTDFFSITHSGGWGAAGPVFERNTGACCGANYATSQTSNSLTASNQGKWVHMVGTWNSANGLKLYVNNGTAITQSSTANWPSSGLDKIILGSQFGINNTRPSMGQISDLRLYSKELSSTDVSDLYYSGLVGHSEGIQVDKFDVSDTKAQGPVAAWHINEGQGTTVNDSTIYKNNLTVSGATWSLDNRLRGSQRTSLSFDNSNDYLSRSFDSDFDFGTGSFTVGGWFRHSTTAPASGSDVLLARYGTAGWKAYMNTSGYVCFGIDDDSTWGPDDSVCTGASLGSLADGNWHHFEAVKTSTTSISIYIDGRVINTLSTLTATGTLNTVSSIYLGIDSDATSNVWDGNLDEFAIFPYARSAAQVSTDFSTGLGGQKSAIIGGKATNSVSTSGLLGYWKMDESSWTVDCTTNTVLDSSGNGYHGKSCPTTTGPSTTSTSKIGYAGNFDGSNDYVTMGDQSAFDFSSAFTFSTWYYKKSGDSDGAILSKISGGAYNGYMLWNQVGTNTIKLYINGASRVTTRTLTAGNWYHIAASWNGSVVKIYTNGVLDQQASYSTAPTSSGQALIFGTYIDGFSNYLKASLDEISIYNRALTDKEIATLADLDSAPAAYWNFEEGQGTVVNDVSASASANTANWTGTGSSHWVPGKVGTAGKFNGSDDVVTATKTISNVQSVSLWVNPSTTTGYFVDLDGGTHYIWANAGTVTATGFSSPTIYVNGIVTSTIVANQWQYVTVNTATPIASGGITIGKTTTNYFNGLIDDVRIFEQIRTQSQIVSDMNGGHPVGGSPVGSQAVYYKFDEGYGTALHDSSPNKMDGVMTGGGWTSQGKFGKAVFFNGSSSQYATVTDTTGSALDITGAITISVWIKNNVASGSSLDGGIVYKSPNIFGATNTKVYEIGFLDGVFYWQRGNGAGGDDSLSFTWDLGAGSWHHVAAVWDGTTTSEAMKIYVDGRLRTKGAANIASIRTTNDPLSISGHSGANAYEFFNGLIDEVKIYSSALSADQVRQDMNQGKSLVLGYAGISTADGKTASSSAESAYCVPGDTSTCRPPVGEWTFEDQSSSTSVPDSSGNANTGTWGGTGGKHYTPGKIGNAGQFNGSDDRVDITSSTSLTPSAVSVSAWFNTTSTNGQVIFRKRTGGYGLETGNYASGASAGQVSFWYYDGAVNIHTASSTSTYNDGKWHFAEGVFDGSNVYIYVDGIQVGKTASTNAIGYFAGNIGIGRDADHTAGYFTGSIDQVKVFDYGRTAAQVAYDYSLGKPISWWKFDECTGTTANDSIGTVSGTLVGGTAGNCSTSANSGWYQGLSGKSNYSLMFGATGITEVDSASSYPFSIPVFSNLSWSGWFYPTSAVASQGLIDKVNQFRLYTNASGNPICGIYYSGAYTDASAGTIPLTLNAWNHVVCTYDGVNIKVYVNGNLSGQTANTNNISVTSSLLKVGAANSLTYTGRADEIKTWSYSLTSLQVKSEYNLNSAVRFGPVSGAP